MRLCSEPEHNFGEFFLEFVRSGAALELESVERGLGLQAESAFTGENHPGHNPVHRAQDGQGALLEVEYSHVELDCVVVKAKRLADAELPKLPVNGISICIFQIVCSDIDLSLLLRDRELQVNFNCRGAHFHSFYERLKGVSRYAQGIRAGLQIRGTEPALPVRGEHDWLGQSLSTDLDPRVHNHRSGWIVNRA